MVIIFVGKTLFLQKVLPPVTVDLTNMFVQDSDQFLVDMCSFCDLLKYATVATADLKCIGQQVSN